MRPLQQTFRRRRTRGPGRLSTAPTTRRPAAPARPVCTADASGRSRAPRLPRGERGCCGRSPVNCTWPDSRISAGSRPTSVQCWCSTSRAPLNRSGVPQSKFQCWAFRARCGVCVAPHAADADRRVRLLHRLGVASRVGRFVATSFERDGLLLRQQSDEHLAGLFEPVAALPVRTQLDAVGAGLPARSSRHRGRAPVVRRR